MSTPIIRPEFIAQMRAELQANQRKGDWNSFRIERRDAHVWLQEHALKLNDALNAHREDKVREYCADIANIAMKIEECFGGPSAPIIPAPKKGRK